MEPVELVEKQLHYYNKRDVDGFCAQFSEDVVVTRFETGEVLGEGMEKFRAAYTERFKTEGLHATIKHRICLGNVVIDHELVDGIKDIPVEVVAIYTITNNKISAVSFVGT